MPYSQRLGCIKVEIIDPRNTLVRSLVMQQLLYCTLHTYNYYLTLSLCTAFVCPSVCLSVCVSVRLFACLTLCVRARTRARARVCVCVCVWYLGNPRST